MMPRRENKGHEREDQNLMARKSRKRKTGKIVGGSDPLRNDFCF